VHIAPCIYEKIAVDCPETSIPPLVIPAVLKDGISLPSRVRIDFEIKTIKNIRLSI